MEFANDPVGIDGVGVNGPPASLRPEVRRIASASDGTVPGSDGTSRVVSASMMANPASGGAGDGDRTGPHAFRHASVSPYTDDRRSWRRGRMRLYSATIAETRDNSMVQAFHASIAQSAAEIRARLVGRFGAELAKAADIRVGIYPAAPLVVALVPAAVVEMIMRVSDDSESPSARTFAVEIQQIIRA